VWCLEVLRKKRVDGEVGLCALLTSHAPQLWLEFACASILIPEQRPNLNSR